MRKFTLWNGYGVEYNFILTLSTFIQIWFILTLATMSPCKGDAPYLWIIKDKLGSSAISDLVGFYLRISY